jgi:hypothetical protein
MINPRRILCGNWYTLEMEKKYEHESAFQYSSAITATETLGKQDKLRRLETMEHVSAILKNLTEWNHHQSITSHHLQLHGTFR